MTSGGIKRRRGRGDLPVVLATAAIIAAILVASARIETILVEQAKLELGRELNAVLTTTEKATQHWFRTMSEEVNGWARLPEVRDACLALTGSDQAPATLQESPYQESLRVHFEPFTGMSGVQGLIVYSPDLRIIASLRDAELGQEPVNRETREFLTRLRDEEGAPTISLPQPGFGFGFASMLVAAEVKNDAGDLVAIVAFRLNPDSDFTEIIHRGRMGESGESYAFNERAQLISESRFTDQLVDIGLVPEWGRSILTVELRDPGQDVTQHGHPGITRENQPLTLMAAEALAGRSGSNLDGYNDYRGVPVVGAWIWDSRYVFGLATEIDVAEGYAHLQRTRRLFRVLVGVTIALLVALSAIFMIYRRRGQRLIRKVLASEERAQRMLDSTPDPIIIVDAQGIMLFANQQASTVLGYASEELIGQSVEILVPDRIRDVHPGMRESYIADPKSIQLHDRKGMAARTKSGREVPISLSLNPIEIEGQGLLVAAALRDETERLKDRDQLDLRAAALKAAANGIVITDRDGIIQWVNPAFSKLTGFAFDEAVGENPRVLNSGVHDDTFFQEMWQTITSGESWFGEIVNKRKDSSLYTEEMTITPVFDESGDIIYFVAIKQNITVRKEMEAQLEKAREEAESANRAKSSFLANMSHELRTPMNAIIGYSEMLIEDAEDEGQEEMVPDLKKIHASGNHLLNLINDILDLSKVEAGRMDLYLESFDLKEMLEESLGSLEPLVAKNANTLVTEFPGDLGMVRADLTKIRQALFNLVSNAAKFTDRGTITIAARRERADEGDSVLIDVTDSGIGIPEDKIDRVFEEFGQADDSTTKEYGGTGLGLPISRKFCRMMGGDITVTSEPGVGSTFSIIIPAQVDAMGAAKSAVSDSAASGEGASGDTTVGGNPILIIDDDPNARDLLSRTLAGEGYKVITAKDGQEGLLKARQDRPSVITLDVQMPGMDGWSVLKTLKADPGLREIPVIMVSIVGDQQTGYALGAVESLSKPVDRDALLGIVSRYVDSETVGTALVVEDDANNRSLLVRTLSSAGWEVLEAENGAVGLEQVSAVVPDLILLDLMMPVMDGFDFVLELRNTQEWREIPIIVVTAKDLTEEDRFRLTGGVETIIQKGAFSKEKFLGEVSHLVHKFDRSESSAEDDSEREE